MGGAFKLRQEAFLLASQGQQSRSAQPQPQAQQVFQQEVPLQAQQGFQQQGIPMVNQGIPNPSVQQYYQYPNVVAPQPMYTQAPGQMQMQPPQQFSSNQLWSGSGANVITGSATGQGEGQNRAPPQLPPTTPPPPQQQPQANPAWFEQNIQAIYAAANPTAQNKGHRTACLQQQEADTHQGHLLQARNGRDLKAQPVIANKLTNSHSLILSRYFYRLIFVYMTKA
jgi:hypothetical protein